MTAGKLGFRTKVPPEIYRALLTRAILLTVFAGSVVLVWWSVNRLAPADRKLEVQNTKIASLEKEIEHLEQKPNPLEAEKTANEYKQAQELLFQGPDEAIGWEELRRQASRFTVKVEAQIGKTQACVLSRRQFRIVSANLEFQLNPDNLSTNSPYRSLLEVAQRLTSQKRRVDLVELSVSGNSNSVSTARMGLELWTDEKVQ
jgi:hypothetical protein